MAVAIDSAEEKFGDICLAFGLAERNNCAGDRDQNGIYSRRSDSISFNVMRCSQTRKMKFLSVAVCLRLDSLIVMPFATKARSRGTYLHGRPQEGAKGSPDPLDFDINFSHITIVAPRVEIQMHFWKGAKFAGSVGHPMTKMLSASGGFAPLTP